MKIKFYSWWGRWFRCGIITFLDVHWNFRPIQFGQGEREAKRIGFTLLNFEIWLEF